MKRPAACTNHILHTHTHINRCSGCVCGHTHDLLPRGHSDLQKFALSYTLVAALICRFARFSIIHRFFAVLFYFFAISLPRNRSAARRQTFCRANNATHKCICCHAFSIYWPAIPKGKYPQAASSIASPPSLPPLAVSICCAIAAVRVRLTMIERLGISGNSHPH